jgi:chromosome segregation ATPase
MAIFGPGGPRGVNSRELEKALALIWNRIDDRFAKAEDRAAKVDDRLTKMNEALEQIRISVKGCQDRLGKVDDRFTKMNEALEQIRISVKGCQDRLGNVEQAPSEIVYVRDTDGAGAAAVHAQRRVKD